MYTFLLTTDYLQHGHQELETARPVADQEHHANQVEDPHEQRHRLQDLVNGDLQELVSNSNIPKLGYYTVPAYLYFKKCSELRCWLV